MKRITLLPQDLPAPFPLRRTAQATPRLALLASISLTAASQTALALDAVNLPPEGFLPKDFRCIPGETPVCPLGLGDRIFFDGTLKFLQFEAFEQTECGYTPNVSNEPFTDGIGVFSNCTEDGSSISSSIGQELFIDIREFDGEANVSSSASVEGIYLSPLTNEDFGGEGCFPNDVGSVEVLFADGSSESFPYESDISSADGFTCDVQGEHAVFVSFGGVRQVDTIRIAPTAGALYASGLELPDVSPETCTGTGENNTNCEIQIGNPALNGGDLRAIITDSNLVGNVEVVGGPWRVRDPRPHCQVGAPPGATPEELLFDNVLVYDYLENGVVVTGTLPLIVSDNSPGTIDFFTIQATSCGIPRGSFTGAPVPRDGSLGGQPYIDIVEIASDIEPTANVIGFESDGLDGTDYECRDVLALEDPELETQPLLELNTRDDEIKILSGVPGIIDPVGRDITVYCGSKRGRFKAFSYVGWNMAHAIQTDMRTEIDAEIQVLSDSVTRYAACVEPAFYAGTLAPWPFYINLYFDYAAAQAVAGNTATAEFFFTQTARLVDMYRFNLELPGVSSNMLRCHADGPKLDGIIDAPPGSPNPINAWGDIVSQLEHLAYAIRSYIDELAAPPPP